MKFQNKKILILCKESYSYPLQFLASKWKETNDVAAYFFMPAECVYNKSYLNEITYYKFKELENIDVYDVINIANKFTENLDSPPIDFEYIKHIEDTYTNFKNLNLQLMSSQFTTNYYHDRTYYADFTYEQQIYWLELNYKNAIELVEKFQPDMIIDLEDSELPRTVINEIAYSKSIPYITIENPRYDFYKYPTYNMGIGIDKYFSKFYEDFLDGPKNNLIKQIEYIDNYKEQITIMPKEFKNTITSQYKKDKLLLLIKTLLGKVLYFWNQDISAGNYKIKNKNKLLYPNSLKYVYFYFSVELKKRWLLGNNPYFSDPVDGENYVYMPLHLIPESTTFVKAPMYVNEMFVIEEISKSLPIGWVLYVKEHQAMLGERSLQFYKKITQLPNVKVVTINYYNDPKPWILKAKGVVTISGSSAFEAALLGKKALVFSDVSFSMIEGITRVKSFEQLPKLIRDFGEIDNTHSCASYIAAVEKAGVIIKFKYLISEGENILLGRTKVTQEYESELEVLENFFIDAYDRYVEFNLATEKKN